MREISFISETHLGDCVFLTDFLNKMIKLDDKIKVNFYIFEKHKHQVQELIEDHSRIRALDYSKAPATAHRAWMAQYNQITQIPFDFNKLKLDFYKILCQELKYFIQVINVQTVDGGAYSKLEIVVCVLYL